jgi:surfeit locus 1 family protein
MKLKLSSIEIFIISLFLIFILLGSWQVKRLVWKKDIINKLEKYLEAEPLEFENFPNDFKEILYKKVKVEGRFHHDKEIHLYSGGKLAHGSDGYLIFTPLETTEGEFILINRGWVPQVKKDPLKRAETLTIGTTMIEGVIIDIRKPHWQTFKNNIEKNVWLWLDIDTINDTADIALLPYYIMQQGNNKTLPIITKFTPSIIRNDHLQYALTWFSLAILSIAFLIILRLKKFNSYSHRP